MISPTLGEITHPAKSSGVKSCGVRLAYPMHHGTVSSKYGSTTILLEDAMTWTKPEFEVVELGMEVGAYAGNA